MQSRTFVVAFFISFFLLTAALVLFNYSIDAPCLYSRVPVVENVINELLVGKIIAGQPAFQYRNVQKLIIEKRKEIPDTIVLGSSRSISVRSAYLGIDQDCFFNHSVPCAVLNDYIAILGCYKKRGAFPKTILLGIDPFVFDKTAGLGEWRVLLESYYYLLSFITGKTSRLQFLYELVKTKGIEAKRLLSYSYTLTNYHYGKAVRERGYDYKAVKNTAFDDWLIAPDGSIYRPFKLRFQDDGTTRKKIIRALNTGKERHSTISFQKEFTRLIDYLLENGSRVVFFLPPYPPPIYQACVKKAPCTIAGIETMLRSLARSRNIPVYGSYNPGRFNLSIKDFIDPTHARDYVVENIFKEYREVARE